MKEILKEIIGEERELSDISVSGEVQLREDKWEGKLSRREDKIGQSKIMPLRLQRTWL